jgi:glucose/arabinose dehydrogenase
MRSLVTILGFALLFATACSPPGGGAAPTPIVLNPPAVQASNSPVEPSASPQASTVTSIPAVNTPAGATANVTAFPDPSLLEWSPVLSGLQSPVDIEFPNAEKDRMFIVEQAGRILIATDHALLPSPFLDISDRVDSRGSEQGLLGLAFHPDFVENGEFFVCYTDHYKHDIISRFEVSGDPNQADAGSEKVLLSVDEPFSNHNGGVLKFGPDGFLYAGLGDGGSGGDPLGNAQNRDSLLGKVLRIDVDHGDPYAVPANNPFLHGEGRPEIWAYGLRNPWRLSFDQTTGDLYIGDVGQGLWEEVDFLPAGGPGGTNLGWNYREGAHRFGGGAPPSQVLAPPVAEYSHNEGGCAITGGYVYRGTMPDWTGIYLYGDYCSGKIWGLLHQEVQGGGMSWQSQLLFQTGANITTFGQDPGGEMYFAGRAGTIYRLERAQ